MVLILLGRSLPGGYVERLLSNQITVPFTDSHTAKLVLTPVFSAFFLFVYSTQLLPGLKEVPLDYFEEYSDVQLPMGATLPKGAMENFHRVLLIYMPCIIIFFWILGPIIYGVKCTILEFRSMLPSAIQDHISRFIGAIERCAISLFTFPCGSTNFNLKKLSKDVL